MNVDTYGGGHGAWSMGKYFPDIQRIRWVWKKSCSGFSLYFCKKHYMAIPSFFKQNKPRGFNYKPRYYDPGKEEWEERRRAMGLTSGADGSGPGTSASAGASADRQGSENRVYHSRIVRGSMRSRFTRSRDLVQRQTTIRLIVILLIIFLIVYIYLRF